ncbi:MAG: nitroreductase family protein [Mariprofundaceae bacterium]|nr:nitroreductase family protein [Mariprofundaceae bacterium]
MNTIDAIKERRSIKSFDANHKMPAEVKAEILSLATLSPTAFNIQNWRFLVVENQALREKIRDVSWEQAQVTDSSLFIVLCADLKAWEKKPERYWSNADKSVQEFVLPAIDGYYRDQEQVQRDEGLRSCGMAAQTLMLAAKSLGYDSCPMDGFDFKEVAKIIQLPDDHIITMFVAIGKGVQEPWPRAGQLAVNEVVICDKF